MHVKEAYGTHSLMRLGDLPSKFDKKALKREFFFITRQKYRGVKGVWVVDSGKPGPVLGVTIGTHGNEPSGLMALSYLRNKYGIKNKLEKGRVIFVLNNIEATRKYLNAKTKLEKKKTRFLEVNMNRLPANLGKLTRDGRYEIRRARELLPIWKKFDVALDIHSMSTASDPNVICIGKFYAELTKGFPVKTIISNIQGVMKDRSAITFYGEKKIPSMGLEAGSHESAQAFRCAFYCVISLLKNVGLLNREIRKSSMQFNEFRLRGTLWMKNPQHRLKRIFRNFERVKKGVVLSTGNAKMPFAGHVVMPPIDRNPIHRNEEVMFFSEPVRKVTVR